MKCIDRARCVKPSWHFIIIIKSFCSHRFRPSQNVCLVNFSSTSLPEKMMSARHHIHFQQVMIPETMWVTEEGNMRKGGMRANLGMTHLRKTKPLSLSRHKPPGVTCYANCRFYTALRLNTISHSLIKETTCSTLWKFHSVCSLSSSFFSPSSLKTTATKKGGDKETVRARDSVLQDHFLPAWKPYSNLLDQT